MSMVNGINGFGNYGVGGYVPQRKEEAAKEEQAQQPVVQRNEEQLVDSSKVLEFMEANNILVTPKTTTPAELAPEVQDRVVNAMERFEAIYPVVVNEFGEELAPAVMDLVMDTLLDM